MKFCEAFNFRVIRFCQLEYIVGLSNQLLQSFYASKNHALGKSFSFYRRESECSLTLTLSQMYLYSIALLLSFLIKLLVCKIICEVPL